MTASAGIEGYGGKFGVGATPTWLAQVEDIKGPKGKGGSLKISNMDSPNGIHEWIPGMWDEGSVPLTLVALKSHMTTLRALIRQANQTFTVQWSDGSKHVFTGHLEELGSEVPLEGAIKIDASFKANSVTYTPAS